MKFSFDNKLFGALGKVVDCVILSVLWLVCCLPVITIGASSTALYYTVHKSIRGNRGYMTKNFFSAFKDNFKPATLSWMVALAVQIVLSLDAYITWQVLQTGNNMGAFFYFFLILIAFSIGWVVYTFAYIARFENTVKITLKNAVLMELRHLPWSLLIIFLFLFAIFLTWLIPFLVFLMPACIVLMFDLILERIFRMYMSPEDLANEKENDMLDKMD